jgi:hypothetical protein
MSKKPYTVTTNVPPLAGDDIESGLGLFDQDNVDIGMFNLVDDEQIRLSGSKILFFKYMRSESSFDDVYMEERNKPITQEGIIAWAHYDPKPVEENLGEFGIELENEQIFVFNKSHIENKINRTPIPGDIIKPMFQNQKYEIFEVQEDEFQVYGVYHLNCFAKLLREHPDIQDTINVDNSDDVGGFIGD